MLRGFKTAKFQGLLLICAVVVVRISVLMFSGQDHPRQSNIVVSVSMHMHQHLRGLPLCKPLNTAAAQERMTCLEACRPDPSNTLEGLGLDPSEKVSLTVKYNKKDSEEREFGKYRYYFPEEEVYLNQSSNYGVENEHMSLSRHAYHERLFRRIIAKLYRAGVLDPSKNLVNSGSNMGDNALPWARMLEGLVGPSKSPGKVYAIDPSGELLSYTVNIANENSISNLCTRMTFIGDTNEGKFAKLDDLGVENLGLLHLDLEGGEGNAISGAMKLITDQRPVIVTEGHAGKLGEGDNDERVRDQLVQLGYKKSNVVPELCGFVETCRNRIWWPDDETEAAAMAVVGKYFEAPEGGPLKMYTFDLPEPE